jgi:hypothetical protein
MRTLRFAIVALVLSASSAASQPAPGTTLDTGSVNTSVTFENDASSDHFGDIASIAPDLAVGVTRDLTLAVISSTYGRTGFRGTVGGGYCPTDDCPEDWDNAGVEALYALHRGDWALAGLVGVHATSFDKDFYSAKLGFKLRYKQGPLQLSTQPSVTGALTERDAMMPNQSRVWLPFAGTYEAVKGLSLGVSTGLKTTSTHLRENYEVPAGAFAQYAYDKQWTFGASWVWGKIIGGTTVLPDDDDGIDARALQVWISATTP